VQSIQPGRSDLHEYKERFDALGGCPSAADVFGLAQWAQERGLTRYVNGLLMQTIELDPEHAEARNLLGFAKYEGNWMLKSERDAVQKSREAEHRTVAKRTVPVRRTTPKPEETPYSLGLPLQPNRSTTEVYPVHRGYSSTGGYVMSIGGVTPGGDVVINYPLLRAGVAGRAVRTMGGTSGGTVGGYR
jgi:hypothetical protein